MVQTEVLKNSVKFCEFLSHGKKRIFTMYSRILVQVALPIKGMKTTFERLT